MFFVIAFVMATTQSDVLNCHHDSLGKLTVSKKQWEYIHKELASKDSTRVLKLIDPHDNLKVRVVVTSFPESNGKINVTHETWKRAEVIERLRDIRGYDYRHPGYTYELASQLVPGNAYKSTDPPGYDGHTVMKGSMLYDQETSPPEPKADAVRRRYLRYIKRFSPITYIRVVCRNGRLWLSEISSAWPAE